MTSEVAVLNKSGVAIAADSAVTTGIRGREKVHTTANKIFTLSKYEPVGVIINGHVEHFGCPWEVLIKDFRRRLGSGGFDTLREYADAFIEHFKTAKFLNEKGQTASVVINAFSTVGELENRIRQNEFKWRAADITKTLEDMLDTANKHDPIPHLQNILERQFMAEYGSVIDQVVTDEDWTESPLPRSCRTLFRRVVFTALTHQMSSQYSTGLIFTGYGHQELFPKLFEITADGGFLNSVRYYDVGSHDVEEDGPDIIPFAQDDIVNSFLNGIDDRFGLFHTAVFSHTIELVVEEALKDHSQLTGDERKVAMRLIEAKIRESIQTIREETDGFAQDEFREPVMDVLRTAPKEMLAELAESLVSITSLRQRVSGELETVSGPVDVALISKGEGFIWIKRKHYFDTKLNPHYTTNYFRDGRHA